MMRKGSGQQASRANGDRAEAEFKASCDYYAVTGRARLFKRPTQMRIIRRAAVTMTAVPTAKAGVDYAGALAGGRAVLVEVKSRSVARVSVEALQPNQWAELAEFDDLGALCLVVVRLELRTGPAWWGVRFADWARAVEVARMSGRASFNEAALDRIGYRCPLRQPYDRPDWLGALEGT